MTAIFLKCATCNITTDTNMSRDGVCRNCIVMDKCKEERATYVRLIAKRMRWELHNRLAAHNDRPLQKAEAKLVGKLKFWGPWMNNDDLMEFIHECRQEAESRLVSSPHGKKAILIARKGDVLIESGIKTATGLLSGRANVGANQGTGEHRRFKVRSADILRPNR